MSDRKIYSKSDVDAAFREVHAVVRRVVSETLSETERQITLRAYRASNELRNASQVVLRGRRSGRWYRVPFTKRMYRASDSGEAPAVRTGVFRLSWGTHVYVERDGNVYKAVHAIESRVRVPSGELLGDILEYGTKDDRIEPRPYQQKIIDEALPRIKAIYNRPYV